MHRPIAQKRGFPYESRVPPLLLLLIMMRYVNRACIGYTFHILSILYDSNCHTIKIILGNREDDYVEKICC